MNSQTVRLTGKRLERNGDTLVVRETFIEDGYLLPGNDLVLECDVRNAAVGAYVIWWKQQENGRKVKVAQDLILQEPFNELARFQADMKVIKNPDTVIANLTVRCE